jgi:aspartate-semialdehyde dehydrogenase
MTAKLKVGFVGWRGMVGNVLMDRMRAEEDFNGSFEPIYFTTSPQVKEGPEGKPVGNSMDVKALSACDIIVTCQGGIWTKEIYPRLKGIGWPGFWLDSSSALRTHSDCIIVLDPINNVMILKGLERGIKKFAGGNCTVSLMLLALHGLFREDLVEWVHSATYQSASGAGSNYIKELLGQTKEICSVIDPVASVSSTGNQVDRIMNGKDFPKEFFGAPLAYSLIPWIDKVANDGQTREEWKGFAETNKILGTTKPIIVDGICVRVPVLRCHSQNLLVKLTRDMPLEKIGQLISNANKWVVVVPNEINATRRCLTPAAVSGKLKIAIGRLHKSRLGGEYLEAFTVGDQLLWGAAEPIRRALQMIIRHLS